MALNQRVGKAVLELSVDKTEFSSGLAGAATDTKAFGASVTKTYRDMVQGMSAAARVQSDSVKLLVGMAQAGRQAAMELQKAQTISQQIVSGMSGRGFTSQIAAQRKELDALAKGMNVAGKEATSSSKLIAGMGSAGQAAAKGLSATRNELTLSQRATAVFRSSWVQMATGMVLGNVAFQAAAGLAAIGKSAMDDAGALVDMSAKTGLSLGSLQRMQFVAKQTSTELDAFQQSSLMLGVNLAKGTTEVKDAVGELKLSFDRLRAASPDQQFELIADALGQMTNVEERNRIAMLLFGRTAKEILPAIAQGYSDIAKDAQVSSDAQVRALDDAGDAWERLKGRVSKAVQGAEGTIAQNLEEGAKNWEQAGIRAERIRAGLMPDATGGRTDIDIGPKLSPWGPPPDTKQYVAALRAAQLELKNLSAADRAQILAAQQLGTASGKELADQFNISEEALRLLNGETKKASAGAEDLAKKYGSLTMALAVTETAVSGLFASEKAEIDAGLRLGVSHEQIAKDLHLSTAAIDLYIERTKAAAEFQKDMTAEIEGTLAATRKLREEQASQGVLMDAAARLRAATGSNVATRGTEDAFRQIAVQRAEFEAQMAEKAGAPWQTVAMLQSRAAKMRFDDEVQLSNRQFAIDTQLVDKSSQLYADMTAEHNADVQKMTEAFEQGEEVKRAQIKKTSALQKSILNDLEAGSLDAFHEISSRFGQMAVGMKDGWKNLWQSMQSIAAHVLSSIADDLFKGFLTNMARRMAGASATNLIGGGAGGGVGTAANLAGGFLPKLLGFGGGAAAATTDAGAWALGAGTLTLGGEAAGAGTAAAVGGTAAAGGIGATIAGLATNPFTIAAAGGLAAYLIARKAFGKDPVNKPRDQFFNQFKAMTGIADRYRAIHTALATKAHVAPAMADSLVIRLDAARKNLPAFHSAEDAIIGAFSKAGIYNIKKYNFGGYVGPGVVQPAILHGGSRGEYVIPGDRMERSALDTQRPQVIIHAPLHVNGGIVSPDTIKELHAKHIIRLNSDALFHNRGNARTDAKRHLGIK